MTVPLSLSSVPAVLPYIQYVATGGQTVYPYPFPITQDADLIVVINGVTSPTDSGYTLSGQGNATGGNVTLNSGSTGGDIITLFRNVTIQRLTQIGQNSGFSSAAFNAEFNNIYLILQQLQESISLSLQIPNTNNPVPTVSLTPGSYANKYMAFDAFGNPTPALLSSTTMTAAVIGGLITPQTGAEAAANMAVTFPQYQPYDVRRYNVKGDGVTDDTGAWNAIGAAAWNSNITLTTPPGFNSKITGTVTLPGPYIALMMDSSSKFTYVDSGTWNTAAIVIGSDTQSINGRDHSIAVVTSGNTYASTSSIGVQVRGAFNTNRVHLNQFQGFTVNFELAGTNAGGIAYNEFYLGSFFDALYNINIHSMAPGNGFVNENNFYGGQIQVSGNFNATYPTQASYGVVFDAAVGGYTGHNNNHFWKPCFQLSHTASNPQREPIWMKNAGSYNQFHDIRAEGLYGAVLHIDSDTISVNNNKLEIGYLGTGGGLITALISETDGGFSYANWCTMYPGVEPKSHHQSGDLVQKAWAPASANYAVLGHFVQSSASGTEAASGLGEVGKEFLVINSGSLGAYVDTTFYKEFEVHADLLATRSGRIAVVAYDSAGTQISSTRAVYGQLGTQNASYGGASYTNSADANVPIAFRVDSTVKTIKILFAPGTNPTCLRSYTITAYATGYPSATSGFPNYGLSVFGGPFAPVEKINTTAPNGILGEGYTPRGDIRWNGNAVAGNTVPAGHICTAAGWNARAWAINTAYQLNMLRTNDTAPVKTYVCRQAGTSAGAGGPTGTGTGIVDNTCTWDYIGTPVTTVATWTALANIP